MWVVSRKRLREFWETHPHAEVPLRAWFTQTMAAEWHKFSDLRGTFPTADLVGDCTVLNLGGNKYRLIARVRSTVIGWMRVSLAPNPLRGPLFTTITCGFIAPSKAGVLAPSGAP